MNRFPNNPGRMQRVMINKITAGINEDWCADFREKYRVCSETLENIVLEVSMQELGMLKAQFGENLLEEINS